MKLFFFGLCMLPMTILANDIFQYDCKIDDSSNIMFVLSGEFSETMISNARLTVFNDHLPEPLNYGSSSYEYRRDYRTNWVMEGPENLDGSRTLTAKFQYAYKKPYGDEPITVWIQIHINNILSEKPRAMLKEKSYTNEAGRTKNLLTDVPLSCTKSSQTY